MSNLAEAGDPNFYDTKTTGETPHPTAWKKRRDEALAKQKALEKRRRDSVMERLRRGPKTAHQLAGMLDLPGGVVGMGSILRQLEERGEAHEEGDLWIVGPGVKVETPKIGVDIRARLLEVVSSHWMRPVELASRVTGVQMADVVRTINTLVAERVLERVEGKVRLVQKGEAAHSASTSEAGGSLGATVPAVQQPPTSVGDSPSVGDTSSSLDSGATAERDLSQTSSQPAIDPRVIAREIIADRGGRRAGAGRPRNSAAKLSKGQAELLKVLRRFPDGAAVAELDPLLPNVTNNAIRSRLYELRTLGVARWNGERRAASRWFPVSTTSEGSSASTVQASDVPSNVVPSAPPPLASPVELQSEAGMHTGGESVEAATSTQHGRESSDRVLACGAGDPGKGGASSVLGSLPSADVGLSDMPAASVRYAASPIRGENEVVTGDLVLGEPPPTSPGGLQGFTDPASVDGIHLPGISPESHVHLDVPDLGRAQDTAGPGDEEREDLPAWLDRVLSPDTSPTSLEGSGIGAPASVDGLRIRRSDQNQHPFNGSIPSPSPSSPTPVVLPGILDGLARKVEALAIRLDQALAGTESRHMRLEQLESWAEQIGQARALPDQLTPVADEAIEAAMVLRERVSMLEAENSELNIITETQAAELYNLRALLPVIDALLRDFGVPPHDDRFYRLAWLAGSRGVR